jgi:hypothetical protein
MWVRKWNAEYERQQSSARNAQSRRDSLKKGQRWSRADIQYSHEPASLPLNRRITRARRSRDAGRREIWVLLRGVGSLNSHRDAAARAFSFGGSCVSGGLAGRLFIKPFGSWWAVGPTGGGVVGDWFNCTTTGCSSHGR